MQRVALRVLGHVREVQRLCHLGSDARHGMRGNARVATVEQGLVHLRDGDAVHPLHGDEVLAVLRAELVDGAQVRVIEMHGQLGLVQKHLHEARVGGHVRQDTLDDHGACAAPRAALAGEKNLGHAAHGQAPQDVEASEARDGRERQLRVGHPKGPLYAFAAKSGRGTGPAR
jgi:hypothetical protein